MVVLDETRPLGQRLEAYQALFAFSPDTRAQSLRQLVLSADEEFAAMAARQLIYDRAPNVTPLIEQQVLKWSDRGQSMVLQALQSLKGDQPGLEIARHFLTGRLHAAQTTKPSAQEAETAALAALALIRSRRPDDKDIVRQTLRAYPQSIELWLGVLQTGTAGAEELKLAGALCQNSGAPETVRVLAALVAATHDDGAGKFAAAKIETYITRLGQEDAGAFFKRALASEQGRQELVSMREQLLLVSALRYLNAEAAERLTFTALGTQNVLLRVTAGMVAGQRWPDRLVSMGRNKLTDDEYVKLLAFTSIRHPELTAVIQTKVPTAPFTAAVARLRRGGVASVFPAECLFFED